MYSLTFSSFTKVPFKLQNFVWLIFLRNETETLHMKQFIFPYDCELIVIQPTSGADYKLTELYTIKNRAFSLPFGTWNKNFGLNISKIGFYRRRQNFQKAEMITVSLPFHVRLFLFFLFPFTQLNKNIIIIKNQGDNRFSAGLFYVRGILKELTNIPNLT